MITTKSIDIENVIITADDIRSLVHAMENAVLTVSEPTHKPRYHFSLDGADGTQWQGSSQDIFGASGPLTSDRIIRARLEVSIEDPNLREEYAVTIKLNHGAKYGGSNQIIISGPNQDWVYATYQKFSQHLKTLEPQAAIATRYHRAVTYGIYLGFIISITILAAIVLAAIFEQFSLVWVIFIASFTLLPGLMVYEKFNSILTETYPKIEIRTGPQHGQAGVRNRRVINWVVGFVILPILTSFVASVILLLWPRLAGP
jgi:hypothetical protein